MHSLQPRFKQNKHPPLHHTVFPLGQPGPKKEERIIHLRNVVREAAVVTEAALTLVAEVVAHAAAAALALAHASLRALAGPVVLRPTLEAATAALLTTALALALRRPVRAVAREVVAAAVE